MTSTDKNLTTTTPRPLLATTWWGIALRIVVAIAMMNGANYARVPLHSWAESSLGESLWLTAAIFLLTPVLIFAFLWAWMRWVERRSIRVLKVFSPRAAGAGLVGGTVAAAMAMTVGWVILALAGFGIRDVPADGLSGPGGDLASVSLSAVLAFLLTRSYLLQGIPEELLFRGWLFDVVRDRPWVAFAWTTAGFTLPHLFSSGGQESLAEHFYYLAVPLGMSVLGAALVLWRKNFWWSAGSHGGFHLSLAILSVIYPLDLGPVAWAVAGFMQVVLGVFVMAVISKNRL